MTRLVINADDLGLSDGICKAIVELMDSGAVSSSSFMVAAPGAAERAKRWHLESYQGRVGVHLQLTGWGKPVADLKRVPSLIHNETLMFGSKEHLLRTNPEEVEVEWTRQIELTGDLLGGPPSHLDSHHGVHRSPHLVDTFLSLAKRYELPIRSGSPELDAKMRSLHVRGPEKVIREWTGRSMGVSGIRELLNSAVSVPLPPDGIVLVSHPGYCDDELLSISTLNTAREGDRIALAELRSTNWLGRNGFELVSYSSFQAG